MPITTPNNIILLALKSAGVLGVGQSAQGEDINDSFDLLNMMLAQWRRKRWLMWHLVDTAITSTGAQSYTVGVGGSFNIARPDRLEDAFFRQINLTAPNQIDYPLRIIEARETYDRIPLKSMVSFPESVFYDSDYPLGVAYFHPVPQAAIYQLHIVTKSDLANFATLFTTLNLPPEFYAAFLYNLTVRIATAYKIPTDPAAVLLAKDSLQVIRGANAQVPTLTVPADLVRPGLYNVYSDRSY